MAVRMEFLRWRWSQDAACALSRPRIRLTRGGQTCLVRAPLMTGAQSPTTRSNARKGFSFLFLTAWVCAGALVKWDARWLYLLVGLTVIAGLWAGRRKPALLRALLLLALVFPAWK